MNATQQVRIIKMATDIEQSRAGVAKNVGENKHHILFRFMW